MIYGPLAHSVASPKDLNQSNARIYDSFINSSRNADLPPNALYLYVDVRVSNLLPKPSLPHRIQKAPLFLPYTFTVFIKPPRTPPPPTSSPPLSPPPQTSASSSPRARSAASKSQISSARTYRNSIPALRKGVRGRVRCPQTPIALIVRRRRRCLD